MSNLFELSEEALRGERARYQAKIDAPYDKNFVRLSVWEGLTPRFWNLHLWVQVVEAIDSELSKRTKEVTT